MDIGVQNPRETGAGSVEDPGQRPEEFPAAAQGESSCNSSVVVAVSVRLIIWSFLCALHPTSSEASMTV